MSIVVTATPKPTWRAMNARRYDADRLLRDLGIGRPPVDVFAIALAIDVDLRFVRGAEWDGAVDSTSSDATIFVNADQALTRQRFTVAHELGHLLLHEPGQAFRDTWSSQGTSIAEIQANNFAANLLMPSWMVNALAPGKRVADLAATFDVSQEAMGYRLKNLGYRIA